MLCVALFIVVTAVVAVNESCVEVDLLALGDDEYNCFIILLLSSVYCAKWLFGHLSIPMLFRIKNDKYATFRLVNAFTRSVQVSVERVCFSC